MADDTREDEKAADSQYAPREPEEPHYIAPETPRLRRKKPMHAYPETQAGKMWKALQPEEPVNTMPGGMVNTAGGKPREISWVDAFNFGGSISDLGKIHMMPCSRDALLVGIGTGGALGGTSFVLTGMPKILRSCNIAVGSAFVAGVGMYTWCDKRRRQEKHNIALAMQGLAIYNEKSRKEEAAQRLKAIADEASRREEESSRKSWYKIW